MNEHGKATSATAQYDAVVIGSGFGGAMTGLTLAREFARRGAEEKLLMLERGTWWTTPVGTVQDKEVKTVDFLKSHGQPVQFWSSAEHLKGFVDLVLRCVRRKGNEDGLYDLTNFGTKGFLGFGAKSDGVSIMRASGVGGGSLVYANVTIQPPDLIFDDPRWPVEWDGKRNEYYDLARNAIGSGIVWALNKRDSEQQPPLFPMPPNAKPINTGLSNISTRTARLDPHWAIRVDPDTGRKIRYIDLHHTAPDSKNDLWIDRARVFQTQMGELTNDFGTVDSSINDVTPEPNPFAPEPAKNYCERQGRCIVGCLPGARHTLNKQLMAALYGTLREPEGQFKDTMSLEALAEVDIIRALPDGTYAIDYLQRDHDDPSKSTKKTVIAKRVIVAAGCVGTNEIMLRSRKKGGLPYLSEKLGEGFSTNGDYVGFVEDTSEHVSLTRGPVTTSFAHFNTPQSAKNGEQVDPAKFHTIEDNGIPRALSSLTGLGIPLVRMIGNGRTNTPRLLIIWTLFKWLIKRFIHYVRAFFINYRERQDVFVSEDEMTDRMMCVAAMGREAAKGKFTLGRGRNETTLRVKRTDGLQFHEDPIYKEIERTLDTFASKLTNGSKRRFINPFLTEAADALAAKSVTLSHPLGGCRMAKTMNEGTVDEYGRVFDTSKQGSTEPFYKGLYIADAAIIPTALGVNPSLTISALALRIADRIVDDLPPSAMVVTAPTVASATEPR